MKQIGITTTVPVEVLIAAGYQPVDLNNVLVNDSDPGRLITIAERAGFPLNSCSWIKGIYGVCLDLGIEDIICVTGGDCSNTVMLMEVLNLRGLNAIPFAYPDRPDPRLMQNNLEILAADLGTTIAAAETVRTELRTCRELAYKLDELTWKDNLANGWENHLWLVSASDFNQDYHKYEQELRELLKGISRRQPFSNTLRLAYIGVPSVYARELYPFIEKYGGRVIYNEIQRQFAMPEPGDSLVRQYTNYSYPYSVHQRLKDIKTELQRRQVDGVIHYVQAFCHRGIADIIFRDALNVPVLTLEGNADFFLNNHVRTRIEAFLDILKRNRNHKRKEQHNRAFKTNIEITK
jgi:benzoyl-CoA reductase/2-hydroxyglutaryl-CoA dehydratase subunit BcrC/BadD/HgdB